KNETVWYTNDFEAVENPDSNRIQTEIVSEGDYALKLPPGQFFDLPSLNAEDIARYDFIRLRAKVRKESIEAPWWRGALLIAQGNWKDGWRGLRLDALIGNEKNNIFHTGHAGQWQEIDWRVDIPESFTFLDDKGKRVSDPPAKVLKLHFLANEQPLYVDDVEVLVYTR
ncbi:MAG: hypothetical protein AAGG02_21535, partial [Cyanobacteria bacterium P01_H01_bin.15]